MKKQNISLKRRNLFDSNAQTLCNAVNTVGVMGAGIAKEFKSRYPEMFADYKQRCEEKRVLIGKPYCWKPADESARWVLIFPTKRHWRNPSQIEWLESGLQHLTENYKKWGIRSLAMPALGCSLGGLDWKHVRPLMEKYLDEMDVPVEIYEPLPNSKKHIRKRRIRSRKKRPASLKQRALF
ncbi:MAG: macro domain-containing protein [Gammaproteobacteria bacterium]|nr:macro domain-containing protein [Gammaproteobacteria bacterium]